MLVVSGILFWNRTNTFSWATVMRIVFLRLTEEIRSRGCTGLRSEMKQLQNSVTERANITASMLNAHLVASCNHTRDNSTRMDDKSYWHKFGLRPRGSHQGIKNHLHIQMQHSLKTGLRSDLVKQFPFRGRYGSVQWGLREGLAGPQMWSQYNEARERA